MKPVEHADAHHCDCAHCGLYTISSELAESRELEHLREDERLRLRHAIRGATDERGCFGEVLEHDSYRSIIGRVNLPDPIEQADMLVDAISRRSRWAQSTLSVELGEWTARLAFLLPDDLNALALALKDLLTIRTNGSQVAFELKYPGWERAREIRRKKGPGNQAFVAMWFHPAMTACFDNAIGPALASVGYKAHRIDFIEHNNKIDDEIVAALRRSRLVIVEATGARNSVYYEAGFAHGLGLPVIWCCHKSWSGPFLESIHPYQIENASQSFKLWLEHQPFDIRQQNFITWETESDLATKLINRVRALGLDLPVDKSAPH